MTTATLRLNNQRRLLLNHIAAGRIRIRHYNGGLQASRLGRHTPAGQMTRSFTPVAYERISELMDAGLVQRLEPTEGIGWWGLELTAEGVKAASR